MWLAVGGRYLEYEVFSEQAEQLCFVTPEVVQLVKLCEGQLPFLIRPSKMSLITTMRVSYGTW